VLCFSDSVRNSISFPIRCQTHGHADSRQAQGRQTQGSASAALIPLGSSKNPFRHGLRQCNAKQCKAKQHTATQPIAMQCKAFKATQNTMQSNAKQCDVTSGLRCNTQSQHNVQVFEHCRFLRLQNGTSRVDAQQCMPSIIDRSSIDWVGFFLIDLYGNSRGNSNGNAKREWPRNEWLVNGLPKKLSDKCQISGALKILVHFSLEWPEQRGVLRRVMLVSPKAARTHNLDYTPQAEHRSFNNLAKELLRLFGVCLRIFPYVLPIGPLRSS